MDKFRLHIGDTDEIPLTRENFKASTKERFPYVQNYPSNTKNGFAICRGCSNPIQLVGLFRLLKNIQKPYGKHYSNDVPGLAAYNKYEYKRCRYAAHAYGACPKEERVTEIGEFEKRIYSAVRDYFDKAIYILSESLGTVITGKMAKIMLTDYYNADAFAYPRHTIDNIPWMLMYLSDYSLDPYGKWVRRDSALYKNLKKIPTVVMEKVKDSTKYERLETTKYTEIAVLFMHHSRMRNTNIDNKKITVTVSYRYSANDRWDDVATFHMVIDESWFFNITHSDAALKYRDEKLLNMAANIMPDLTETVA